VRVIDHPAEPNPQWTGASPDPGSSSASYKVYNIGNNNPVKLMDFIEAIEQALGKKIEKNFLPLQAGDVPATYADVQDLVEDLDYQPATPVQVGIERFVEWYRSFFAV